MHSGLASTQIGEFAWSQSANAGARIPPRGGVDALRRRAIRLSADRIEEKLRGFEKRSAALRFRAIGFDGRYAGGSEASKRSWSNFWIQSLNPARPHSWPSIQDSAPSGGPFPRLTQLRSDRTVAATAEPTA
jgi:hypothetical protein